MRRVAGAVERRLEAANRYVHAAVRAIAAARPLPSSDGVGWNTVAAQHGVLSLLAAHLPHAAHPELRAVRLARAVHHMRAMADLRGIDEAFAAAGVEWLLFKGPVLAEAVYQRPGARAYGDLDILVRPDEVAGAVAILEQMGARTTDGGWRAMRAIGDGESAYQLPGGTVVDLHWDVINDVRLRVAFAVSTDSLFERSRQLPVDGLPVSTFDPVDTILHVAMHACHSGGDRLRWLMDIHQSVLRCDRSLVEVLDRADAMRLGLVLRVMLNRLRLFVDDHAATEGLPPPTGAQRLWLAVDSAVMTRYPPGSRYEGRFSGSIISDSTRGGLLRSWQAMARVAPSTLWGRWSSPQPGRRPDLKAADRHR